MDKAELNQVFNRFYRGDKSRQRHEGGSGLGLAIAKSIVESHNGRIWAESAPGQGATFIIELPLATG
jgi:signal transduction histidine kinase